MALFFLCTFSPKIGGPIVESVDRSFEETIGPVPARTTSLTLALIRTLTKGMFIFRCGHHSSRSSHVLQTCWVGYQLTVSKMEYVKLTPSHEVRAAFEHP